MWSKCFQWWSLIGIGVFLMPSLSGAQSSNWIEEEWVVASDRATLYGSLRAPEERRDLPVVLFIAGSGQMDRNGNGGGMDAFYFEMLADSLQQAGIASFRYDKRTAGKSEMEEGFSPEDMVFDFFVKDAIRCLQELKKAGFSEWYVLGHSQGSLVGMLALQEETATGFISVAGAGQGIDTIICKQLNDQLAGLGDQAGQVFAQLRAGESVDSLPNPLLMSFFAPRNLPFLKSWIILQPTEIIAQLPMPVLVVQGTHDIQVSVDQARRLHAANEKSDLLLIEGMSHVLKPAPAERMPNLMTYYESELPLDSSFVKGLLRFIQERD